MINRLTIILLIAFFNINGYCQSVINYAPKQLFKEFSKYSKSEESSLKEIPNPKSITNTGKYFYIQNTAPDFPYHYVYIGRVNTCRAGGCSGKSKENDDAVNEYFDYFILFDKSLSVKLVKVFDYQASHGQEMTSVGWLRQFIGYNSSKSLSVGKEIDAISGATISVNAITEDIKEKSMLLKKIIM